MDLVQIAAELAAYRQLLARVDALTRPGAATPSQRGAQQA
jgi:hypothetical protein